MKLIFTLCLLSVMATAEAQQYPIEFHMTFDSIGMPIEPFVILDSADQTNRWEIGAPHKTNFQSAYVGINALVTDTIQSCIPNDTSSFIMKVPRVVYYELLEFSFWYKLDKDSGDIAMIEMSADSGLTWVNVMQDTNQYDFYFFQNKPDLSLSTLTWTQCRMLPAGQYQVGSDTFLFRFTYITDSSTAARDGWIMDYFLMGYDGEGVADVNKKDDLFVCYPNPSNRFMYINTTARLTGDINYTLTGIAGQVVKTGNLTEGRRTVDIQDVPTGIYHCRLTSGKYTGNKLITIQH